MTNARYFASRTPVQETDFCPEHSLDLSIGLSRNERNYTLKYFPKMRALMLTPTAWAGLPAHIKAMDSQIQAYTFSPLVWSGIFFDLLDCEGKEDDRKRDCLGVLLGKSSF